MARKTVYNNLVTEEQWKEVNEENKILLQDFIDYLISIGRSEETVVQYKNDIRIFMTWYVLKGRNKHFTEIKKREVVAFQNHLMTTCGMSSARIRRLRSSISSLSNYIENILDDEYPDFRNIINKIEAPVLTAVREKTILTFEECERVANQLILDDNMQLACLLMFACYSGLRKQELTRLLLKDFTTEINMALGDNFYKTSPIKVKGRGNRTENKFVWNKVDKYLKLWLKQRQELGIECEYLFCREIGGKYGKLIVSSMNSFAKTLERYFQDAIYWHSFRHVIATELTRSNLPIDVVQFLLGHKSSETTKIYIDISSEEGMDKFADFFSGKVKEVKSTTLNDL